MRTTSFFLIGLLGLSSSASATFNYAARGPEGEILVQYVDGENLVIKKCDRSDQAVSVNLSDCHGKENRIPLTENELRNARAPHNQNVKIASDYYSPRTYRYLLQYDASRPECGTSPGRIFQRSQDCAIYIGSFRSSRSGYTWVLITRKQDPVTRKFYEVWQDNATGLVWSDRLDREYSHFSAINKYVSFDSLKLIFQTDFSREAACISEDGNRAAAGITEEKFSLASMEEFLEAERHGLREILPNFLDDIYWTSTPYPYMYVHWRLFNGSTGTGGHEQSGYLKAVRCVGRSSRK